MTHRAITFAQCSAVTPTFPTSKYPFSFNIMLRIADVRSPGAHGEGEAEASFSSTHFSSVWV